MPLIGFRHRARRAVLIILAAVAALLLAIASPASAHAELAASDPADDAILTAEPDRITLTFTEEVDLRLSAVKVIGPDGRRLDAGALRPGPTGADSLTVALGPDQTHGTFSVAWQVTASDDGHTTSGHLTFAVGAPSAVGAVASLGHNRLTGALSDGAQWAAFAGLALVSGITTLRTRRAQTDGGLGCGEPPAFGEAPERPSAASLIRQDAGLVALTHEEPAPGAGPAASASVLVARSKHEAAVSAGVPLTREGVDVLEALPSRHEVAASAVPSMGTAVGELDDLDGLDDLVSLDGLDGLDGLDELPACEAIAAGFPDAVALSASETAFAATGKPLLPIWPATLGWTLLLVATVLQILTYAPASRGLAPSHLFDRSLLAATLATRNGHALMARIAILALAAFVGDAVIRRSHRPAIPLVFTLAVAATWGTTGHAAAGAAAPPAMASLTLHVAAMALWVGGLAVVALLLVTGRGSASAVAATAANFSRLALAAVGVLVATGLYQAWREVGGISALTDSAYGRLLLLKVALLLVVLAVASRSRALVAGWREGDEAALRSSVLLELAGAATILVLAVLLSGTAAPRA